MYVHSLGLWLVMSYFAHAPCTYYSSTYICKVHVRLVSAFFFVWPPHFLLSLLSPCCPMIRRCSPVASPHRRTAIYKYIHTTAVRANANAKTNLQFAAQRAGYQVRREGILPVERLLPVGRPARRRGHSRSRYVCIKKSR